MNFQGPRRILEVNMYYDIDGDGEDEEITDTMAVLTRSGNLKFVFLLTEPATVFRGVGIFNHIMN
jgi:hypothetical protein